LKSANFPKLIKISWLSKEQVIEAEFRVCKHMNFISEEQIKTAHWALPKNSLQKLIPKMSIMLPVQNNGAVHCEENKSYKFMVIIHQKQ